MKTSVIEKLLEKADFKFLMNSLSGFSKESVSKPNRHELMTSKVKEPNSLQMENRMVMYHLSMTLFA